LFIHEHPFSFFIYVLLKRTMKEQEFDPRHFSSGENTSWSAKPKGLPKPQPNERFLKGPIPWSWLAKAASQPGRALAVALHLWLWAGMTKSREITVSVSALAELGVGRNAAYRALSSLERANLITVVRHVGRKPRVTLLDSFDD
jgi:hypothetical protein